MDTSVRKSAHGRTQLFLPTAHAVLREVECMGGMTRYDSASVYHTLPPAREGDAVACWHCCEPIARGEAIPLPRLYDSAEGVYHVYGATCSPGCAKAYTLEHTAFDRSHHLNVLVRFLREVYGVCGPVVQTPPRPALKRFGGPFDPRSLPRAQCMLVTPPFVSYCMLAEERVTDSGVASMPDKEVLPTAPPAVAALEEPVPPPLFQAFAEEQDAQEKAEKNPAPAKRRRVGSAPPPGTVVPPAPAGPLARFFVPK